jgi:hypothetical protein
VTGRRARVAVGSWGQRSEVRGQRSAGFAWQLRRAREVRGQAAGAYLVQAPASNQMDCIGGQTSYLLTKGQPSQGGADPGEHKVFKV